MAHASDTASIAGLIGWITPSSTATYNFPEFDDMIVKGKRTKRSRPSSSTSSRDGGGGGGGIDWEFYPSLFSSPTTSASTEEDEDMANCLILLARGGKFQEQITAADNSRTQKSAETASENVAIYVYQCKTCNRTFPSFQALGGHRANHKKPMPVTDHDRKKSRYALAAAANQEEEKAHFNTRNSVAQPSTQSPTKSVEKCKPKIHECSLCGSEFASGQALGSHTRKHRSAAAPITSTTIGNESPHDVGEKPRKMLTMDLNLPPPPEDEHRNKKLNQFSSGLQPPRLVFSAAALVDCLY